MIFCKHDFKAVFSTGNLLKGYNKLYQLFRRDILHDIDAETDWICDFIGRGNSQRRKLLAYNSDYFQCKMLFLLSLLILFVGILARFSLSINREGRTMNPSTHTPILMGGRDKDWLGVKRKRNESHWKILVKTQRFQALSLENTILKLVCSP